MDFNPMNWTWDQAKAAGRHVMSFASGAVIVGVSFHFLSPEQGAGINENIGLISDGVSKIAQGVAGLLAVLAPIYASFRAANSASPANRIAAVTQALNAPAQPAALADPATRAQLVNAVAVGIPEVKKIETTPAMAVSTPSQKVVS